MVDSPITSTPGPSRSSLRQSLLRRTINREEMNDDEEERSSLVTSERAARATPASTASDRSISSTPQKEHYQGCLKLYAENKITKDNAWSLHLIDFMASMLRRRDRRMEDLQTASTMVDASARIYSFRVDAVHHDVLRMAGGLAKAVHSKRGKKDDDGDEAGAEEGGGGAAAGGGGGAKKKKRLKGAIAANPDMLNGDFETNLFIDPFFERLAATAGDVTSSGRAFNATLPVCDRTLALRLRTDTKFLEAVKENLPERVDPARRVALPAGLLPPFAAHDHVCRPFTGFSISNWDPDTEDRSRAERWEESALDLSQQAVAFDVHADVEPVEGAEGAEGGEPADELAGLAGLDSDEEADAAVAACVARAAAAPPPRLLDMRPTGTASARLEYSYCALSAWAGPAHWRLKHNRASKLSERTASVAGGASAGAGETRRARARRPLEFASAGLAADWRAPPAPFAPAPPARVMISRRTLATGPAWNENNYKTPVDRGLDESFFRRLFLRRSAAPARPEPAAEPERLPEEARHYDYGNENDASYCPLAAPEESWEHAEGRAAGDVHAQPRAPEPADFADMIEPPAKIAKMFIPYAMRAKKVDMKQLKQCTWRLLTEGGGGERAAPTSLFSVYGALPARLAPDAREGLSVPLALLALLHLANEQGLALAQRPGLDDVDVLPPAP